MCVAYVFLFFSLDMREKRKKTIGAKNLLDEEEENGLILFSFAIMNDQVCS
jgi:hypothetical protein